MLVLASMDCNFMLHLPRHFEKMRLSIIIPTYNEADNICDLLGQLHKLDDKRIAEIIIADGGSTDLTCSKALEYPIRLIRSDEKSRANQMNKAAAIAEGDIYYFIHADTRPPISFVDDIEKAWKQGHEIGSYSFKLDSNDFRLKLLSFMTRINMLISRGGDQTLFVTKAFFTKLNGFDEKFVIMEDFDFIRRARKLTKFKLMDKSVLVSARKYAKNNYFTIQRANLTAFLMFYFGVAPHKIKSMYEKRLQG